MITFLIIRIESNTVNMSNPISKNNIDLNQFNNVPESLCSDS